MESCTIFWFGEDLIRRYISTRINRQSKISYSLGMCYFYLHFKCCIEIKQKIISFLCLSDEIYRWIRVLQLSCDGNQRIFFSSENWIVFLCRFMVTNLSFEWCLVVSQQICREKRKKKTNTKNGSLPTPNILVDWDKLCLRIRLTVVITLDNIIGWSIIFSTFKCIIVPLFFYLSLPIWEYSLVAFSILFKCTCVVCVIGK